MTKGPHQKNKPHSLSRMLRSRLHPGGECLRVVGGKLLVCSGLRDRVRGSSE
jgi:hypothetical protein